MLAVGAAAYKIISLRLNIIAGTYSQVERPFTLLPEKGIRLMAQGLISLGLKQPARCQEVHLNSIKFIIFFLSVSEKEVRLPVSHFNSNEIISRSRQCPTKPSLLTRTLGGIDRMFRAVSISLELKPWRTAAENLLL